MASSDFLSTFQAEVTRHWDSICATHADILEKIENKDLPELMKHDDEDPHGILALTPGPLLVCAGPITTFGDEASACTAEISLFHPAAEGSVIELLESCDVSTYESLPGDLREVCDNEKTAVEGTKLELSAIEGKSYSAALKLVRDADEVDQMDDEKKAEAFEKLQAERHSQHVSRAKQAATELLAKGKLPAVHGAIRAKEQVASALQRKADVVASKCGDAETLYAGLQQQQDELSKEIDKCERIRRTTVKVEEAKRKTLQEAEKARQLAWKEYQDAYLRNEAATIMEGQLREARDAVTEELAAAGPALAQTQAGRKECCEEAAGTTEALRTSFQAAHTHALAFTRPSVEEAWRNTALARGLCQCLVDAKQKEHSHLLEEQHKSQKKANKLKEGTVKARKLEEVEKMGVKLASVQSELTEFENLSNLAEEQLGSFQSLKSGLDGGAIASAAQDDAAAWYGTSQRYVSDDDSDDSTEASGPVGPMAIQQHAPNPLDKLRIEMEEKFKIEKQQLLAEFQLEKQQMMLMMREEMRALSRDDASSLKSWSKVDEDDEGEKERVDEASD